MSATTEQIKERLGIVEVVSQYLKLEKSGSNFKALCPFHNEKTPSLFISPSRNTYYCFGCGAKGDIFTFVQEYEGVDFKEALKMLADKAGVEIVHESSEKREVREKQFELLEEANQFFEKNLKENKDAQEYLKDRGVDEKSIEKFRIGYVHDEWHSLYDFLNERGYSDQDMSEVGLIKRGDKGYYDTFRSRITFPISDSTGRVIAFTGRIFPNDDKIAKYLNSPETKLFSKSHILYGFHIAKLSIRKANFSIVVEGQMDVVMSHQAGYPNTVALSGTALTEHQVKRLKQLSNNIVFAFDSDKAGINSSGRSAEMALSAGMDVKVAKLPQGKDPADMVVEDPELLKDAVRNSVHIVDFYLNHLQETVEDKRKLNKQVEEIVLPFVARIPSSIDQQHFIGEVARRLGLPEDAIREEVAKVAIDVLEVTQEPVRKEIKTIEPEELGRKEVIINKLFGILFSQKESKDPTIDLDDLERSLKDVIGEDTFSAYEAKPELFEQETFFLVEVGYQNEKQMKEDTQDLLQELVKEYTQEQYNNAMQQLKLAESKGDQEEIEKYLRLCKELSEKIESF